MKKIQCCMLAVVLAATSIPISGIAFAADIQEDLNGDVTLDGTVNGKDTAALQQYLLGNQSLTVDAWKNADLNQDGIVNGSDLAILRQKLAEWIRSDYAGIVINEACTSNQGSYQDASGNTPDWIELYNASDHVIDLSGCGLSDGKKNPFKFTFPNVTVLSPGEYLIVLCDDTNVTVGEFHAAFKLSADGETIRLSSPDGILIDMMEIPALEADSTYGRYSNGSGFFSVLTPTPGASNDTGKVIVDVAEPIFSVEGGFYNDAFDLTVTSKEQNAVYYTTDGSDPTTSKTAMLYTDAISIYDNTSEPNIYSAIRDITISTYYPPSQKVDKGIVIRAAAKDADGNFSDVVTNSYFVGKTASYYSDMKVVSLVTDNDNLFSSEDGIYVNGDAYYTWKDSAAYVEYEDGDTRNPTNYNQDGRKWERPASIQVFEDGSLAYTTDIGIRIAGNWSRAYPQKSIRFYARSEYGDSKMEYGFIDGLTDTSGNAITSFDKITLRNSGTDWYNLHFRDELIQSLVSDRAVDVQGTEPCILFIDGEFWGVYSFTEKLDGDYVESHYGIDKDDVTTIKCGEVEGSESVASEYRTFANWAMRADMTDEANYQKVCDVIDIQSFMDYIAIETYINNYDWSSSVAGYMNNWQMWRSNTIDTGNPYADGKWRFMLYDTEYSTELFQSAGTSYGYDSLSTMYREETWWNFSQLFYNLLNNNTFREQFYANYLEIMENNFEPNAVNDQITQFVDELRPAITATNIRYGNEWINSKYDSEVELLRNFFNNRPDYAKLYLDMLVGNEMADFGENLLSNAANMGHYATNGGAAAFSTDAAQNSLSANVTALGENAWDIQAQFPSLTLEKGKVYRLSFEASCSENAKMDLGFTHQVGSEYIGFGYANVNLTPKMQEFSLSIPVSEETNNNWILFFNFGSHVGNYTVQNVKLVEVSFDGS